MKRYNVLYVGNYTKDTIISPAGTKIVDGGAVNYKMENAGPFDRSVNEVEAFIYQKYGHGSLD